MAKRYDVCTPRPKKDGGTYWVKVGSAWEGDRGIQVVFDALPMPDTEGRCAVNLFEPKSRDEQHRDNLNRGQRGGGSQSLDDDIPF